MVEYLKLPEVARRLDVSEKTARRYVKSGALPSVFIGNAYRVSEEDLEKYLRGARVQPGDLDPKAQAPLSSTTAPENKTDEGRREELRWAWELLADVHSMLEEIAETYKSTRDANKLETLASIAMFTVMGSEEFIKSEVGPPEDRASTRVYTTGARLEEFVEDLLEYLADPTRAGQEQETIAAVEGPIPGLTVLAEYRERVKVS